MATHFERTHSHVILRSTIVFSVQQMSTYPTSPKNEPEILKLKTRDDEIEKQKYQTEKHDYENIIKSLKNDNEYSEKKCKF